MQELDVILNLSRCPMGWDININDSNIEFDRVS